MDDIHAVDVIDRSSWRQFVNAHPFANVFHTPEMTDAFAHTPGHRVSPWAARSGSGAILALFVPVEITLAGGPLRGLTSRAVVYGGVLAAEGPAGTQATRLLLAAYVRGCGRHLLFSEIRHQHDASEVVAPLRAAGFVHEAHLNYLVPLRAEAELWRNLGRSAKQRVRSAEKKGVIVEEVSDDPGVEEAYALLRDVYRRARVPLASAALFAAARQELEPHGMLRIFIARLDDRIIGARFVLLFKSRMIDWYAGSDRSWASHSPNELLVWHALRWGRSHGFDVFDFGGAGRPDEPYGPRDFKAKFGGDLVGYGRDTLVHSPRRLQLSRTAYAVARRVRP